MDGVYNCCIHTLETPTVLNSACSGRFLAGDEAACSAIAKNSGVVVLKAENAGATPTLNLSSYDRVDHVHTLSVQGAYSYQDDCGPVQTHARAYSLAHQAYKPLCRIRHGPSADSHS